MRGYPPSDQGQSMKRRTSWGERLRQERTSRLWSYTDLAKALAAAAGPRVRAHMPHRESLRRQIRGWESGEHMPSERYRLLLARVYEVPVDELFAGDDQAPNKVAVLPALPPVDELLGRVSSTTRRRAGTDTVAALASRVHALRLADDVIAGGDLIGPATRELDAAVLVYQRASHSDEVGRLLLSLVGECAQITGWIASDAGQYQRAAEVYRLGISAAREAGDGLLESNLVGSLAYQVSNVGAPSAAVQLAQASLDAAAPIPSGRARALAWDRLAWAHARAGEAQETVRALGNAAEALAVGTAEAEPSYLYWVNEGELQVMEARAYTELRRPLRAIPLLTAVLTRYDSTHARELALYLSWLAIALIDANEPEEAAAAASRMLDLSVGMTSDRTRQRAAMVLQRLAGYRDVPAVAEVLDRYQASA